MKIRNLIGTFTLAASAAAFGADAPFGLQWGVSLDEVVAQGVVIEEGAASTLGRMESDLIADYQIYSTTSIEGGNDSYSGYHLYFSPDNGLEMVTAVSEVLDADYSAKRGREVYQSVKSQLTEQYGEPYYQQEELHNRRGMESKPLVMYGCLVSNQCGYWMSAFSYPDGQISALLDLRGIDRSTGVVMTHYTARGAGEAALASR